MVKLYIEPPSIETLFGQFIEWFARNMHCKLTLKVEHKDGTNWTEEYDARNL